MRSSFNRHIRQIDASDGICQTNWQGEYVPMDLARIEFFLDDGWHLIGRLHQWLSKWPEESADQIVINDLIRDLQKMWATANDFGATHIARNSLALELMLERFCAGSLELSVERLEDFTAAVACLQELLLGLEATREEPNCPDLNAVLRIERHTHEANWADREENSVTRVENTFKNSTIAMAVETEVESPDGVTIESPSQQLAETSKSIERTLLKMLEQFVLKLDDISQQLHARMVSDQTPYVTTTSRLEHLAQVTRELVDQILHQPGFGGSPNLDLNSSLPDSSVATVEFMPLIVGEEPVPVELEFHEAAPSSYSLELAKISSELAEMLPAEFTAADSVPAQAPSMIESQIRKNRVLIVEESLFYRHLLSTAVISAGYEPHLCESLTLGFAALAQSSDFAAVLVDSKTQSAMVQAFRELGRTSDIRFIGMTTTGNSSNNIASFDDCASKTHPQKLIGVLDQVLNHTTANTRISA